MKWFKDLCENFAQIVVALIVLTFVFFFCTPPGWIILAILGGLILKKC